MDHLYIAETFLGDEPTIEQRWQALRLNIQACYERLSIAEGKEEMRRVGDIRGTYDHLTVPSEESLQDDQQLDHILDWYRHQRPLHSAICWYLYPTPPAALGARLFARGVEPNWQPHWMWYELSHLQPDRFPTSNFEIKVMGEEKLPHVKRKAVALRTALTQMQPRRVWYLIAFQSGREVGRCMLNVTTGAWGVGGLFDMGVNTKARKQGIGTALAQAACELARELGCRHIVLNATEMGRPVYSRVGFQSMGYGYTWFLSERILAAPAPANDVVTFLEAIGLGNISVLDETVKRLEDNILHRPTLNGLTPLDIAVRCQQPGSATWLVEHGVSLDLLSAWDLGWKEQLPILLAAHPELVNLRRGEWYATPLHIAIQRGDSELAQLLLTVPNDLEIKDAAFKATALGWAQHFQRPEIIALLEQHRA